MSTIYHLLLRFVDASKVEILRRGSFIDIQVSSLPVFTPKLYIVGLQSQMVPRKEKKLIKNKQVNSNPEILTWGIYQL